ncbi:Threonylcarbamoyl-AMP synthase [hydrothermal vent metagenome]|uniref:L-threonylcarbamoyladenylate synthase n=1 Tax=hydrothermal vent metagenome TaxID=652676 RepID=A0A3B1B9D1_9ZZZZ
MNDKTISEAVQVLRNGGVIAYPTESVYGLGCDPANIESIKRLLAVKQRQRDKGLILIASDFLQLEHYLVDIDERLQQPVLASWPGPHTWLWPAKSDLSRWLRGQHETLAVRVSDHPLVAKLCKNFGGALISTSANLAHQAPAHSAQEVREQFADELDYILEGETGNHPAPTEIRDVLSGKLIRSIAERSL